MARVKRLALKNRIIKILKENDDRIISAKEMKDLLIASGLSSSYIPTSNGVAQTMRIMKGVNSRTVSMKGIADETYLSEGYYLESEDAWTTWVATKVKR